MYPNLGYILSMASSSTSLRFTAEDEEALKFLMAETGATKSEVVRAALQVAVRDARRARARAEVDAMMADPVQRAELAAVKAEMDEIRAR